MPTQERKAVIEKQVDDMLNEHVELTMPAFDIVKFMKEKMNFAIASNPLIDDTTGMLFVDDEKYIPDTQTNRLIVINSMLQQKSDYVQRRRFIIAHEFGHYILHKRNTKQYAHRDSSKKDTTEEKEADFFARCLLMPKEAVIAIMNLDFIKTRTLEYKVSLISRIFNVTKKKAQQRLKEDLCYNE